MASTNKTSLGLNMWEASDKPVRMDFNNDNTIIDQSITKLNSDYVSRTTDNIIDSQIRLTKSNGINGSSYHQGSVWLRGDYCNIPYARAQIGFENVGHNAITLWLDIDGRLKATNNNNVTSTLATTDDLSSFAKVTFTSMAVANGEAVTVGSYTITTAGTYLVSMNQYFNYPNNAEMDIRIALNENYVAFNGDKMSATRHRATLNCSAVITASAGGVITFHVRNTGTTTLNTNSDPSASFGNVVKLRS